MSGDIRTAVLPGKRPRTRVVPQQDGAYSFEIATSDSELTGLKSEWAGLFARVGSQNPFVSPEWMIPWFKRYVPRASDRLVVVVRRAGEVVAVAPFYFQSFGITARAGARTLQLAGGSKLRDDRLTELSEVLVAPAGRRSTYRALLHHLAEEISDWDWLDLSLPAREGYFEAEWLPDRWRKRGSTVIHKGIAVFVVLPLPRAYSELHLKRNMKEALRRSRNRLAAAPGSFDIRFACGQELPAAVERLIELHRLRAGVTDHVSHSNYFADDTGCVGLLRDAAQAWAVDASGMATVAMMCHDDLPIAARLVLQANRGTFLSCSGFDPEYWRLGTPATLTAATIRREIERGSRLLNLSATADSAKLRWSEELEYQNSFIAVAPRRQSRALFQTWWQLRAARTMARSRRVGVLHDPAFSQD